MKTIRIATRASRLALWQAHYVSDRLIEAGYRTEIITMDTIGDKILDVTIAGIGSKGVFTEELEVALAQGHADIAVHSAKDMQSTLPREFELISFTQREKVNDVLVAEKTHTLDQPLVIGTSSTRRVAFLKHFYPNITTLSIRGNLQTRIRKMQEGQCDALLLAYAGISRMGYTHMIRHTFDENIFTPAVGQGSMAVEAHESLEPALREIIRQCVNDEDTECCLLTERAFLKKLEGGCSIPVFGLAQLIDDKIVFEGGIISLDGKNILRKKMTGNKNEPKKTGEHLAAELLDNGGDDMLKEIKIELK